MNPKKCKDCGQIFQPFKFAQPRCFDCAVAKGRADAHKQIKREKKKRQQAFDAETRRRKKELNRNDMKWQHKNTQAAFNKMRVLQELRWFRDRGIEPYCISCLKTNMDWCCGHLKTVGAHPEWRYEKKNTFLQCNKYCNQSLSGNIKGNKHTIGYEAGLVHRFGEIKAKEIMDYVARDYARKYTIEELESLRADCFKTIRELNADK